MPILQGFILYRAVRYQEDFPANLKCGCYSDTIHFSTKTKESRSIQGKRNRKLARYLDLTIETDHFRNHEIFKIIRQFPRRGGIRKCSVTLSYYSENQEVIKRLVKKLIHRTFKTLKRLKEVKINGLGTLQREFKTLKNLFWQRSLESLTLSPLDYSEDSRNLAGFLKLAQVAERRNCWPYLKSLVMGPFREKMNRDPTASYRVNSIAELLKFLRAFKACKNLYKYSKFQIEFPQVRRTKVTEPQLKKKIFKLSILPHMTHIDNDDMKYLPKSKNLFHNAKHLKSINIKSVDSFDQNIKTINMRGFKNIPNLEKIVLRISDKSSLSLYESALLQLQNLVNLLSFTVNFNTGIKLVNELGPGVCKVLSSFLKIESIVLYFNYYLLRKERNFQVPNCSWQEDAFKIIAKKKGLKTLILRWEDFPFEECRNIFNALCKCLKELTALSTLKLDFGFIDIIADKDVLTLANAMKKLAKMENFELKIDKTSGFKTSTFLTLLHCLTSYFPLLSYFDLLFKTFKITNECYQAVYETIRKMKCLNQMTISIKGEVDLEDTLEMEDLEDEIHKRMYGFIRWREFD